ncbi:FAD-dependent oxidoreductase [Candidatus Poribacteria bacterium]|nr:FAD-dependent oxidoreductase [Candidatus Poribacteria bacterium]
MRTAKDNFWLDTPYEAGSPLVGGHEADVAIIGGGFTGLASAHFMKKRFPEKRIIVLESEFIGYGSSGRNTGVASGTLGNLVYPIKKLHGIEKTSLVAKLALQSLSLVEELIEEHRIECDFEKVGRLVFAENERAIKLLEKEAKTYGELGSNCTLLDRGEARNHFGALNAPAALRGPDEAILNPAKFVRGMKRVAESVGVEVYEYSRCTRVEPGPTISLYTALASVRAANIVIATNAYPNPLGLLRHKVLPFYVYNIVTEPLTKEQIDELHWLGREMVCGTKNFFVATRFTADNRLVFISNNALYFYDVDRDYSHQPAQYQSHYKLLTEMFPFLKGIKITHKWGGRIGASFDALPSIGCTGKHQNIYYSIGYYGHGVAFSQLAGKMLAELMAGEKIGLTDHFLINKPVFGLPSAGITYLGANGYKLYMKVLDWLNQRGK